MRRFGSDHTGVGRSIVYGERAWTPRGCRGGVAGRVPAGPPAWSHTPFKVLPLIPPGVKQQDGQELSNDLDAQVSACPALQVPSCTSSALSPTGWEPANSRCLLSADYVQGIRAMPSLGTIPQEVRGAFLEEAILCLRNTEEGAGLGRPGWRRIDEALALQPVCSVATWPLAQLYESELKPRALICTGRRWRVGPASHAAPSTPRLGRSIYHLFYLQARKPRHSDGGSHP